ncbi:hypothetical protein HID58_055014 [Brassica napus]|uniref:Uncharacterized protein n=1 Tax=Brassica napus TaxID=3708 RepID=A0ABQ8AKP6_BRANA|nr:hypothetical protein HID58_055014 [Brassica napus]
MYATYCIMHERPRTISVLMNLAGLPPHSSPDGILLPGGTTEPASRIERVSTSEPSISIECCPMIHSGSMVHDLRRLYAPTVTYLSINVSAVTCWGRPRGMDNAPFLHIRAEPEGDFVEIAAQNGAVPDGRAVPDGDLTGQDNVGRHVGINGYLRKPLPQGNDLSLSPVVPIHTIRRRRHRRFWLRRLCLDRDRRFRSEVATDQVRSYSSPRESSY